ncbi:MAG TPA: amidohydrolase family protein [Candidatus Dormibacteraeota bacterium]|nr:amidohydrolase family protein [Candidatus Dormibacteraeota bacterium]
MRRVLTNVSLIDCVTPQPITGASVTIERGRIVEVLHAGRAPDTRSAQVVDLQGAYLLPGLWDVHIHPDYLASTGASVAEQTAIFGHRLMEALTESGVTGVRCAGAAHFMDVAWKRAFDRGQYVGPRVFAAGHFLTTTGGHFLTSGHARECDGPYGFVRAIREQIKSGVDHIKLNLTGGIMGPAWDRHSQSFLLDDELEAAFAICHQRGFPVMAHAANPETVQAAVRLGAHSVEHGYIMDAACIESLRASPTWYVPTLAISHLTPDQARDPWEKRWVEERGLAPDLCRRADAAADQHRRCFQQALAAGVKMALGSDIRPLKEAALLELGLWVRDGATPWQALLAATRHAAELCGAGHELGTVEPGKLADLIVVAANPLENIANLRELLLVFKEGRIVSDKRAVRDQT